MILDNTYLRLNVRISNYLCFNHFVLIPLALPPPTIAVSSAPLTIAGGSVSLTCTATAIDHLVVTPDLQWLAPDGSDLVTMGDIVQFGLVFTREVVHNTLHTSQGGQYRCEAALTIPDGPIALGMASTDVRVQSEY